MYNLYTRGVVLVSVSNLSASGDQIGVLIWYHLLQSPIAGKAKGKKGEKFVVITHVPQASQAKKSYKGCDHKLHFPSNLGLLMWVGPKTFDPLDSRRRSRPS